MELLDLLRETVELDASDLYVAAGAVPSVNKDGRLRRLKAAGEQRADAAFAEACARRIMSEAQWRAFLETKEANLAFMEPAVGRFRVNIFYQRGSIAMVFRRVRMEIPTLRQLGLPPVLRDISLQDRGIVLVTGATGSGKSTTMAAMINYRNQLRRGHIVTIEDPIEFLYRHGRSIVTQRELGIDTFSFHEAMKNSLRQAPQVIVLGELRDAETVQFALHAAETGHLVFATLHSTNTTITIERILNFFPAEMSGQLLHLLAMNLQAIITQRLVPRADGGRAAACEILINTPTISALVKKGHFGEIREALSGDSPDGMTSMDKSLYKMVMRGIIPQEEALGAAESANDLAIKLRGIGIPPGSDWEDLSDPWAQIPGDYDLPGSESARRFAADLRDENGAAAPAAPPGAVPPGAPGSRPATPGMGAFAGAAPGAAGASPEASMAPRFPSIVSTPPPLQAPPPQAPSAGARTAPRDLRVYFQGDNQAPGAGARTAPPPSPAAPGWPAAPARPQPAAPEPPAEPAAPESPPPHGPDRPYYRIFGGPLESENSEPPAPPAPGPPPQPGKRPPKPPLDTDLDLDLH